jgi:cellulose synthase/poly-beta-1,6-N-acetylglucosamine synthase-like glycosyltransferase
LILEITLLLIIVLMSIYLARHYIFTFTVLFLPQRRTSPKPKTNDHYFSVSVLIPALDEERVIGRILQRMTELTYSKEKLQVIVIDDASKDRTFEIAQSFAEKFNFIQVVRRDFINGRAGKAEALNEGLKHATGEIVYCFDADYYPQLDILEKLTAYFADPKVGAVQGRVTVLNEPYSLITRLVTMERTGGYRVNQQARDELGLIPQFGGTVGGFRRDLLESLGGWDSSILAEDTDLTFRAYLAGYKVRYVNEAECYEEAVEGWRSYWHQRSRWAKGHMQCAFKNMLPFLKCKRILLREKVDGFLVLSIYFVPLLILLSLILNVTLFFVGSFGQSTFLNIAMLLSVYSVTGGLAPFFEVGIGAYLDQRVRALWLMSMLVLLIPLNIAICVKAFLDLCVSKINGNNNHKWMKTCHNGNGNCYITNQRDKIFE